MEDKEGPGRDPLEENFDPMPELAPTDNVQEEFQPYWGGVGGGGGYTSSGPQTATRSQNNHQGTESPNPQSQEPVREDESEDEDEPKATQPEPVAKRTRSTTWHDPKARPKPDYRQERRESQKNARDKYVNKRQNIPEDVNAEGMSEPESLIPDVEMEDMESTPMEEGLNDEVVMDDEPQPDREVDPSVGGTASMTGSPTKRGRHR